MPRKFKIDDWVQPSHRAPKVRAHLLFGQIIEIGEYMNSNDTFIFAYVVKNIFGSEEIPVTARELTFWSADKALAHIVAGTTP